MSRGTTSGQNGPVLWQIGDPDSAVAQFFDGFPDQADETGSGVEYVVGRSDPRRDWPGVHPGPLDATSGFVEHSAAIVFEAPADAGEHWHLLRLRAIASHGPCPDLRLDLGGRRALVALRPVRADRSLAPTPPSPTAGPVDRDVVLPAGSVRAGTNRLVLTTVDHDGDPTDPGELARAQRPDLGVWFGSAISWSGVSLARGDGRPPGPRLEIEALPLYVETPSGLAEQVEVVGTDLPELDGARVSLTIGDAEHEVAVPAAGRSFGDVRARVAVPEFTGTVEATARLSAGATGPGADLTTGGVLRAARKWTLHVLPHVHLDIGYTDAQAKVVELHSHNLDEAVDIAGRQDDYAFSVDGSFIIENFLRTRTPRAQEAALAAIRSGRIGVNAFWALLLSGVAGVEELHRALYLADRLRREHGVPITFANLTDVPSYSQALPSILAAAGIDGFMGIANHTRGGNAESDTLHLLSPVRWEGPDGADVLSFFSDCYSQLRFVCGDPPTLPGCTDGLVRFLRRYERDDYLPADLPLVGTHADNEDLSHGYAALAERWNDRYAWPRMVFSTIGGYLDAVRPLRDRLPVLRGDGGSYWEDGVGTQARAMSVFRRTQMLLPAAETVSALVAAIDPDLRPDTETLDRAWDCALIGCEHTWTSSHATARPHSHQSVEQLDWKVSRIDAGLGLATDEMRRALSQLGTHLSVATVPSLLVVNPAGWTRTAYADLELPDDTVAFDGADAVPAEPLGPSRDGVRWWRLQIAAIPAYGYRLLPLRPAAGPAAATDPDAVPAGFETPHYAVTLDPATGAITGLHHRVLDRDVADPASDWTIGDVLYVSGGGSAEHRGLGAEATTLFDHDPVLPPPNLTITVADLRAESLRRTPWGWTLRSTGSAPTLPQVSREIRFYADTDRIDVTVTLDKEAELAKESVYVAFPFAVGRPTVHYDRQQGWVDPGRDHQPGACNEWLTVQHAAAVSDDALTVHWSSADAPLFTVDDVVRGTWPTEFTADRGTLLSWVMNNYWFTNTPASQSGHVQLRYSFAPAAGFDPVAAARLGRELRTPLLLSDITFTDRCDDEPRDRDGAGALLRVDFPDHIAGSVFAGRAAPGVVLRLQELGGTAGTATVTHPGPGREAHRCSATEEPLGPLDVATDGTVTVPVGAYAVETVLLR